MSNIERKYAYYDEGVLPEEGEYGVTYLTLYSSSAGNIYDGWIYDPDNKIPVSAIERTFGYRHPEFSQYCWDDEVVVDLSNPQSREESDFTQGRIVSFNTNVSPYPIVLEDVDISEMTESEREQHATTVLFTAIPLVSDAYIQAQVEVQCKCNLSPDNTSGEMRIEAFYILNDESDRTMRPNPVHTFTVSSANERHTLPWLYFNPALRHDDNNYIGVKLICTGGTAEIGISDVREYGDAIITLTSAGLTGDKIYDGQPSRIWIEGEELVPIGYELDIEDYDVFCEYTDGSVYLVTHFCSFSPEVGTPVIDNIMLTAEYMGLHASLRIMVAPVESIEITGLDTFYGSLLLDIANYNVLGYLENGDVWDVTNMCTYTPIMGTTITQTTALVATFTNPNNTTVTDSLIIEKVTSIMTSDNGHGLIYTLYDNRTIEITGNADFYNYEYSGNPLCHENIQVPYDILMYLKNNDNGPYILKWAAEGDISGIILEGTQVETELYTQCARTEGFDDVNIVGYNSTISDSPVLIKIYDQRIITSTNILWLNNISKDAPVYSDTSTDSETHELLYEFRMYRCTRITNLDFAKNWNMSRLSSLRMGFSECDDLVDISGAQNWDVSNVKDMGYMFYHDSNLKNMNGTQNWDVSKVESMSYMCEYCTSLENIDALWFWRPEVLSDITRIFNGCSLLDSISALTNWNKRAWRKISGAFWNCSSIKNVRGTEGLDWTILEEAFNAFSNSGIESLVGSEDWIIGTNEITYRNTQYSVVTFKNCEELIDISSASYWDMSRAKRLDSIFVGCSKLRDISPVSGWNTINVEILGGSFSGCDLHNLDALSSWLTTKVKDLTNTFANNPNLENIAGIAGWITSNVESFIGTFKNDPKLRYVSAISGWDVSKPGTGTFSNYGFTEMFYRDVLDHANNHIIDADSLSSWNYQQGFIDGIFTGTDVPYNNRYLHNKLYPLPSWYITARGYMP